MPGKCHFLYSANNSGQTGTGVLVPMISDSTENGSNTPATIGGGLATRMNAAPSGDRWLCVTKITQDVTVSSLLRTVKPSSISAFYKSGAAFEYHYSRMFDVFTAMRQNLDDGVLPERLVFDEEPHLVDLPYSYYALGGSTNARAAAVVALTGDPVLTKLFPASIRSKSESFWQGFSAWTDAVGQASSYFDAVYTDRYLDMIRRVGLQAYCDAFDLPAPPAHNYGDSRTTRRFQWPSGQYVNKGNASIAGISAPDLYPTGASSGWEILSGLSKPVWWNQLIYFLNVRRSIVGPCEPWLAAPGYDGDGRSRVTNFALWGELVKHLGAMGDSQFVGWVPGWTTDERTYMENAMTNLDVATDTPDSYEPIAYDAGSITTNGYTTTYSAGLRS